MADMIMDSVIITQLQSGKIPGGCQP